MRRGLLCVLLLAAGCVASDGTRERLQATVKYLASDELQGRRTGTPEGEAVARWMAAELQKAGLKRVELQKFKTKGETGPEGLNVIGFLEGATDEWVALCCHHDHLGVKDGQIYNGADDNASGCAVLIEVARRCAASTQKPKRGLLFCSFDAEEILLGGSRYFVGSGLVDSAKIVALVCMDMMGGDFLPRDTTSLYVLGAENSPELQDAVAKVPTIEGLDLRPMGVNVIEPMGEIYARSDYGSFRAKRIPFVFLSTGQPWTYHKPEDDAERLNYAKMEKGVGFVHRLMLEISALEARPRYLKQQGIRVEDLKAIGGILRRFHPEDLDLSPDEVAVLTSALERIDKIVAGGAVTSADSEALKTIAATLMGFAARRPKGTDPSLKTERFDQDPGWDGRNNRSPTPESRTIRQDFGWKDGRVGGLVTPAAEPAYYGKKIAARTLDGTFAASGTLVMEPGGGNTLVGFFNAETLNEWRTPNSIVLRLNGRGDEGFHVHLEYATAKWRAGGNFYLDGKSARLFPPGKVAWTLAYDPKGTITATLNGEALVLPLDDGHKADGATFNRFGILNVMKSADGGGTLWLDDVTVNGERDAFDADPKWEALNARKSYLTENIRPRFNFGFTPTHFAGGAASGEMGGLVFRGDERYPDKMAYYGDRLEPLTLDRPLRAKGRVSLRRGVTDSTVLLGFFHSTESMRQSQAQKSGFPENFLGVAVEGPSREGFLFYPAYGVDAEAQSGYGAQDPKAPHILPDGASHLWTLDYDPKGSGTITVTLDGKSVSVALTAAHRAVGAKFDRFGLITAHIDGNGQQVYFDDLTYTAR